MARLISASCRLCRREGEKLFLKGPRCTSSSCAFMKREYAPGQHGQGRRKKDSGYAIQLREKQKAKRIYGILEKQFSNYFKKAERAKGATGEVLLQLLERRLDNVIFRACFAMSRAQARQLVGHGFVSVNGKRVDISSYTVKTGEEITVVGKESQLKTIRENAKLLSDRGTPDWIEASTEKLAAKIVRLPKKDDIGMAIEENLIVELYSK